MIRCERCPPRFRTSNSCTPRLPRHTTYWELLRGGREGGEKRERTVDLFVGTCVVLPTLPVCLYPTYTYIRCGYGDPHSGCIGSRMQCVRDCQHPWFGGNGECIVGTGRAPVCVCDSGFSAFDVLGQPACESKAARTACHAGGCCRESSCLDHRLKSDVWCTFVSRPLPSIIL